VEGKDIGYKRKGYFITYSSPKIGEFFQDKELPAESLE